jgi:hypothetical protein
VDKLAYYVVVAKVIAEVAIEVAEVAVEVVMECYGPNNSSSYTTGKRYKQTSSRSTGGARTS